MSVTSDLRVIVEFGEDIVASNSFAAAQNTNSPGQIQIVTLGIGANTITPPSGGTVPVGVTIVPPAANTNTITLKGVTGDTGVVIHVTNPTHIGLNSPTDTFVLTASAEIEGVRLVWS